MDLGEIAMWLRRDAVPGYPRGGGAEHAIGLVTGSGPLEIWLVARDQPPRGGLGIGAAARGLRVAAEIQGHPVLGETSRMALVLGGGR